MATERVPQVFLFLGLVAVAVGVATGAAAMGDGLRDRDDAEQVVVTGSARRRITSDTVVWRASVTSTQPTPAEASGELSAWVDRIGAFLSGAGATEDEVKVGPVTTEAIAQTTETGYGETGKVAGYRLTRTFVIRSSRVREITDIVSRSGTLLDEGIPLAAEPPEYRYSKLAELRPDLQADASRDATARGQGLVAAAGGRLGALRDVSAGVFQITAPDSTDTSSEGVYDTSTIEKDITAVVRLTFGLR